MTSTSSVLLCSLTCFVFFCGTTAFVNAVCHKGLRPDITGCPGMMKAIITKCWDATPSSRPCLSSLPLSHVLLFSPPSHALFFGSSSFQGHRRRDAAAFLRVTTTVLQSPSFFVLTTNQHTQSPHKSAVFLPTVVVSFAFFTLMLGCVFFFGEPKPPVTD